MKKASATIKFTIDFEDQQGIDKIGALLGWLYNNDFQEAAVNALGQMISVIETRGVPVPLDIKQLWQRMQQ